MKKDTKPTAKSVSFYKQNQYSQFNRQSFFDPTVMPLKVGSPFQSISNNQIQERRILRESQFTKVQD